MTKATQTPAEIHGLEIGKIYRNRVQPNSPIRRILDDYRYEFCHAPERPHWTTREIDLVADSWVNYAKTGRTHRKVAPILLREVDNREEDDNDKAVKDMQGALSDIHRACTGDGWTLEELKLFCASTAAPFVKEES
jgi:hypothetical protein